MSTPAAVGPTPVLDFAAAGEGSYARRLVRLVSSQRRALTCILIAAGGEAVFSAAGPWLTQIAIDEALPNQAPGALALLAGLVLGAAVHALLASWIHHRTTILLQHHLEAACLTGALRSWLHRPFETLRAADFGTVSEGMQAVGATVRAGLQAGVTLATQSATAALSLLVLALSAPGLAAATLAITAAGVALGAIFAAWEARLADRTLAASSRHQDLFHVLLRSVACVRAFGATERSLARWYTLGTQHAAAAVAQARVRVSRELALNASQQLLAVMALGWLVHGALSGAVSVGQLMMATLLVANFTRSAASISQVILGLRAARPQFARADALLGPPESAPRHAGARVAPRVQGALCLERVWFRYGADGPWVLEDYSCSFEHQRINRLQAASGWGKTTILRLLSGLARPERGRVSVFGHDPHVARDWVAYLPQQSSLLEASIATNLCVLSGEGLQRALEVAELTGLSHLLRQLPMGIETPVSAAGGNLSAGQRQLILLTAIFATRRPVLLLDEPTAHLDEAAKARIAWDELARGRTIVLVEHAARQPSLPRGVT